MKPAPQSTKRGRRAQQVSPPGPDFAAGRLPAIHQLIAEAFTEEKVDFDKLRTALGGDVDERPERYSFTWAGKRKAILELQKPTWGTLVPVLKDSVNFDTTLNLLIEGENLEVLKLLYKSYFGRVKLIYIDPPYNTGNVTDRHLIIWSWILSCIQKHRDAAELSERPVSAPNGT